MLAAGRVRLNGKVVVAPKTPVLPDSKIDVIDQGPAAVNRKEAQQRTLPFKIIYEDDDVLVVDKPAGMITSSGPHDRRPTLQGYVYAYIKATSPRSRIGLIHRLDRDAMGLLIFSKNSAAYESLKTQFFKHTVERRYLAVVRPVPKPLKGTIDYPLEELKDGTVYVCREGKGQPAVTHYEVVKELADKTALVQLTLHTGRKHQIRVHLAKRGWPIIGDSVYGGLADDRGMRLCAVLLGVDHPMTEERMTWETIAPFV